MTAAIRFHAIDAAAGHTLQAAMIAAGAALALAALIALVVLVAVFPAPRAVKSANYREPDWWPEFERDFARYVAGLRRRY
jgi:hypothetical protein